MNLTQQERDKIYYEEKSKHEGCCHTGSSIGVLFIVTIGALAGMIMYKHIKEKPVKAPSIEELRKAYAGLDVEE
ncbi:hypothetical protein ACFL58_02650 [Elusimicrobiota bacterium]